MIHCIKNKSMTFFFHLQKFIDTESINEPRDHQTRQGCIYFMKQMLVCSFLYVLQEWKESHGSLFWVQLFFVSWNFLLWRNQFPKLRDIVSKRLFLVIILKHMVWMMKGKKKSNIWYLHQAEYFSWRISKWPSIWPNCRRFQEKT